MTTPPPGFGDPTCRHERRERGICQRCGHCEHDVVVNGACFYCASTELDPIAMSPKPPASGVIPASQLVRKR